MEKIPFTNFIETLVDTINSYDFFVNWKKINENVKNIERQLNLLNSLIGKEDIEMELKSLITEYPEVIEVFPILIAVRDKKICVMNEKNEPEIFTFINKTLSESEKKKCYKFFKATGLESLIREKRIKNLVDYVFGVEVGMDTNGRKGRTGTSMENLVEKYINLLCLSKPNLEYITQATQARIFNKWHYDVHLDKTNRRFDFAIFSRANNKIFLIEVNFYSSQGSKLKATAGEYETLELLLKDQRIDLIWITDGKGWQSSKNALEETYKHNRYVLNLSLLNKGALEEIISG